MGNNNEFAIILECAAAPVRSVIEKEWDQEFADKVSLHYRNDPDRLKQVEEEFHAQRQRFKQECYVSEAETGKQTHLLDSRKVAAVLCRTYLRYKAFSFDSKEARLFSEKRKKVLSDLEYTKWAVNNTLVNYKFAYLVSTQLVYMTLLADLLENETDEVSLCMGNLLNKTGHLFWFESDPRYDTVDTNIIVGLARGDGKGQDLNMMLYAMLLHQHEIYTQERLKNFLKET